MTKTPPPKPPPPPSPPPPPKPPLGCPHQYSNINDCPTCNAT